MQKKRINTIDLGKMSKMKRTLQPIGEKVTLSRPRKKQMDRGQARAKLAGMKQALYNKK